MAASTTDDEEQDVTPQEPTIALPERAQAAPNLQAQDSSNLLIETPRGRATADQTFRQGQTDEIRNQRAAAIQQRQAEIAQRNQLNSQDEANFRAKGIQFYTDPATKRLTPVKDEQGRTMYHRTPWSVGAHPKTGEPSMVMRDQFGQMQYRPPTIVPDLDPTSDQMMYKLPDGSTQPAGAIDDLAKHPNYNISKQALAAKTRQTSALHRQALAPLVEIKNQATAAMEDAKGQRDLLDQQIASTQARVDDSADNPIQAAAYSSRLEQLQVQRDALNAKLKPGTGELATHAARANGVYRVAAANASYQAYLSQAAEIRAAVAARGGKLESDPTYQANQSALALAKQAVDQAETGAKQTDIQASTTPRSTADSGASDLEQSEPFALAKQGITHVGGVALQEMTRRYGSGQGAVQPDSLLRIADRIAGIKTTLARSDTTLNGKVRGSLQQEQEYLDALYKQRLARLPPDQAQRVIDATRDPTLVEKGKGVVMGAVRGAGSAVEDVAEFGARNAARAVALTPLDSVRSAMRNAQETIATAGEGAREGIQGWNATKVPEVEKKLRDSAVTGIIPEAVGGVAPFVAGGAVVGAAGKAAGLSGRAVAALTRAATIGAGGAQAGNSLRTEAIQHLAPLLRANQISKEDYNKAVGLAELGGTGVGAAAMGLAPITNFAQRLSGLPAGKSFISTMLDNAGRGGTTAVIKWLAGDAGKAALADVVREGTQMAGVGFGQSLATDLAAKASFDKDRKVSATKAGEQASQMGVVGAILGALTHVLPKPSEGTGKYGAEEPKPSSPAPTDKLAEAVKAESTPESRAAANSELEKIASAESPPPTSTEITPSTDASTATPTGEKGADEPPPVAGTEPRPDKALPEEPVSVSGPRTEPAAAEAGEVQYTIQRAQPHPSDATRIIPGYVQIERQANNGRGEPLTEEERAKFPHPPDWLPTGQYTESQIREAIKNGPPAETTTEDKSNALRQPSPEGLLQRKQTQAGETGSERGRVEQGQQGDEPAKALEAGQEAVRETPNEGGQPEGGGEGEPGLRAQGASDGRGKENAPAVPEVAEPLPPAQMKPTDRIAELKAAGVDSVNGKSLSDANAAELINAVGKLRRGQLDAGPKPDIVQRLESKLRTPKKLKEGKVRAGSPGDLYDAAHDAAIQIAILAIKAGRALNDVVKLATDRFKAKFPGHSAEDLAKVESVIRAAYAPGESTAKPTPKETTSIKSVGALTELKRVFAPQTMSEDSRTAAGAMREHGADLAQRTDRAAEYLDDARKYLDKQPESERWDFVHAVETGEPQANKELQPFADKMRTILDDRRTQVQALGTGALEKFIEDYFPHIWKDPKAAISAFQAASAKRPLEGSKSFLKKRTIPTTREGMALGLEPVVNNPVDLALLKVREMDKYILARKTLRELEGKGLVEKFSPDTEKPDGWKKIDDRIATIYGPRTGAVGLPDAAKEAGVKPNDVRVFGRRIMSEYYAPPEVAQVINNYLSPGLRGSKIFRGYLGLANVINSVQLGLSAFHLGFTSLDAATSRFAIGLEDFANGKGGEALKSIASTPLAPITNAIKGDRVLKEWLKPGTQGAEIGKIVDSLKAAGGRAQMDRFYQTEITKKMLESFRSGGPWNFLKGAARAPFAAIEQTARPIMEYIVPRQKLGVFADMARREMDRLGPDASRDDVRKAMGKAWDSVDNRLGQLVYDNLFWKKAAKDLSMASARSLGWNLGTLRELGGGLVDSIAQGKRIVRGEKPELTHRMAYLMAMPMLAGTIGAMTQYMMTGKGPAELKDYFFPKTGEKDQQGRDIRLTLPSYMKDVYHYSHDPVGTVTGKIHPMLALGRDMLTNKDYFDRPIRNPDDPLVKQATDVASHLAQQFAPIGVSQALQARQTNQSPAEQAANFAGVTRAPKWVSMSDAEQLAEKLTSARSGTGSVPTSQGQYRYEKKRDLLGKLRNGDSAEKSEALRQVRGMVARDEITQQAANQMIKGSRSSYLVNQLTHLDANEAVRVFRAADTEERRAIRDTVGHKITRAHMAEKDKNDLLHEFTRLSAGKN